MNVLLAGTLVNRAWQEIRDTRQWSWLLAEDYFFAPPVIASGTATVTQFSTVVQMDALVAGPLCVAAALANPPLTSRQFRVNGGATLYNIVKFDPIYFNLTLDRPIEEGTQVAQYQIYRCYYQPNNNDFLRFRTIVNPNIAYSISGDRLDFPRQELDRRDPQRMAFGDAYYISPYKVQTNGVPIFEFWPHPTNSNPYNIIYQRRGANMVADTDDIPITLGSSVLMEKSLSKACEWASKNVGEFPKLKGTNWIQQAAVHKAEYKEELAKAQKQDDEIMLQNYIDPVRRDRTTGPIDANFLQSHDI